MAKEIKRIEMLDKQQLENILIKLVDIKNAHRIVSNNAKILINKEYRKALGSASLKI
jgi:hypothetical protein